MLKKEDLKYTEVYTKGPSYILPNGMFLNLIDNGIVNHIQYEKTFYLRNKTRKITHDLKWIRINDRYPKEVLAELPIEEITKEQYKGLEMFLNSLLDKGTYTVSIGIEPEGSYVYKWSEQVLFFKEYSLMDRKIEYIINDIKNFYKNKDIE